MLTIYTVMYIFIFLGIIGIISGIIYIFVSKTSGSSSNVKCGVCEICPKLKPCKPCECVDPKPCKPCKPSKPSYPLYFKSIINCNHPIVTTKECKNAAKSLGAPYQYVTDDPHNEYKIKPYGCTGLDAVGHTHDPKIYFNKFSETTNPRPECSAKWPCICRLHDKGDELAAAAAGAVAG